MTTGPTTEDHGLRLTIDDESADGIAGSVYRELRAAICDTRLEPNQRLVQNNLADQLGISRTPVRDALMRLAQEGLVHPAPQRGGYLVSEFTARFLVDDLGVEPDRVAVRPNSLPDPGPATPPGSGISHARPMASAIPTMPKVLP